MDEYCNYRDAFNNDNKELDKLALSINNKRIKNNDKHAINIYNRIGTIDQPDRKTKNHNNPIIHNNKIYSSQTAETVSVISFHDLKSPCIPLKTCFLDTATLS